MPTLSELFHDFAMREELDFSQAVPQPRIVDRMRRERHRAWRFRATGGALAVGALAVGVTQGAAGLRSDDNPKPGSSTASAETPTGVDNSESGGYVITRDFAFDATTFEADSWADAQFVDERVQCGASAPSPSDGPVVTWIEGLDLEPEPFVELSTNMLESDAEASPGYHTSQDDAWAQLAFASTGDELHAKVASTALLFVQDGEIVAVLEATALSPERGRPDGLGLLPGEELPLPLLGPHLLITPEPTSFTTAYAVMCASATGEFFGPGDYQVHPGEYQVYAVARVMVNEATVAGVVLTNRRVDLGDYSHIPDAAQERGFEVSFKDVTTPTGTERHVIVTVSAPATVFGTSIDEVIVSPPFALTVE